MPQTVALYFNVQLPGYHRGVYRENVHVSILPSTMMKIEWPPKDHIKIHSSKWDCDESHLRWNGITFLHKIFASFLLDSSYFIIYKCLVLVTVYIGCATFSLCLSWNIDDSFQCCFPIFGYTDVFCSPFDRCLLSVCFVSSKSVCARRHDVNRTSLKYTIGSIYQKLILIIMMKWWLNRVFSQRTRKKDLILGRKCAATSGHEARVCSLFPQKRARSQTTKTQRNLNNILGTFPFGSSCTLRIASKHTRTTSIRVA